MSNDPNLAFGKYSIVQHLDKGKMDKMDKANMSKDGSYIIYLDICKRIIKGENPVLDHPKEHYICINIDDAQIVSRNIRPKGSLSQLILILQQGKL